MSTLLELKEQAAHYLDISVSDLTVDGTDLFLAAANRVRRLAELSNDFEFSRKLAKVTVNGSTGGDLSLAVDASNNPLLVKTVIEAGLLDTYGNLAPVIWTTNAESMERTRGETRGYTPRYPTDAQLRRGVSGTSRFNFAGNTITRWPKESDSLSTDFELWLEVYTFQEDWTTLSKTLTVSGSNLSTVNGTYTAVGRYNSRELYVHFGSGYTSFIWNDGTNWLLTGGVEFGFAAPTSKYLCVSTANSPAGLTYTGSGAFSGTLSVTQVAPTSNASDIWLSHGASYILWASIVHLNHRWKTFVPRTEGNLPPPKDLAAEGLQTLISWDANTYELFRRHNR